MRDAHQPRCSLKTPGFSIGLGWQQRTRAGQRIVHHGGGTAGFQTYLGFDPITRAGVVIMGNSAGFEVRDDVVFQLLRGRKFVVLPSSTLAQYTGTYALGPDLKLTVSMDGDKLFGQLGEQPKARMYPDGSDSFVLITTDAEVRFSREAGGTVTSAKVLRRGETVNGPKLTGSV